MRTHDELLEKMRDYAHVDFIHDPEVGYLSWRTGTGGNLEILFLEAAERGKGLGRKLLRRMCQVLVEENTPPYYSVFCFCLGSNVAARRFYANAGFSQMSLPDEGRTIYGGDDTVLLWVEWHNLLDNLGLI